MAAASFAAVPRRQDDVIPGSRGQTVETLVYNDEESMTGLVHDIMIIPLCVCVCVHTLCAEVNDEAGFLCCSFFIGQQD